MICLFDDDSIKTISQIFNSIPEKFENCWNWIFEVGESAPSVSLSLYIGVEPYGGNLLSVQTVFGFYELHNIVGWDKFSSNEVIFWSGNKEIISAIIMSKNIGISFYSNVERRLFDEDITKLDPALLLSIMQLSLYKKEEI